MTPINTKNVKALKKKLNKNHKKKAKAKKRAMKNFTPPRYDDVYFEGVVWLDSLD